MNIHCIASGLFSWVEILMKMVELQGLVKLCTITVDILHLCLLLISITYKKIFNFSMVYRDSETYL